MNLPFPSLMEHACLSTIILGQGIHAEWGIMLQLRMKRSKKLSHWAQLHGLIVLDSGFRVDAVASCCIWIMVVKMERKVNREEGILIMRQLISSGILIKPFTKSMRAY